MQWQMSKERYNEAQTDIYFHGGITKFKTRILANQVFSDIEKNSTNAIACKDLYQVRSM